MQIRPFARADFGSSHLLLLPSFTFNSFDYTVNTNTVNMCITIESNTFCELQGEMIW